jgi:hypothetical protein
MEADEPMYDETDIYETEKMWGTTPVEAANAFRLTGQTLYLVRLTPDDIKRLLRGEACAIEINGDEFHVALIFDDPHRLKPTLDEASEP